MREVNNCFLECGRLVFHALIVSNWHGVVNYIFTPKSINASGAIAGCYIIDGSYAQHGFLRAPDGTLTTFDAPGASTAPYQGTGAVSINTSGAIAGYYIDGSNVQHGFLRAPDGTFTTLDAPGAPSTEPKSINQSGAIAGNYWDSSGVSHGFVAIPLHNSPHGHGRHHGRGHRDRD